MDAAELLQCRTIRRVESSESPVDFARGFRVEDALFEDLSKPKEEWRELGRVLIDGRSCDVLTIEINERLPMGTEKEVLLEGFEGSAIIRIAGEDVFLRV